MKLFFKLLFLIFLVAFSFGKAEAQSRSKINFGTDWEFKREEKEPSNWEKVTIPYTNRIESLVVIKPITKADICLLLLMSLRI